VASLVTRIRRIREAKQKLRRRTRTNQSSHIFNK
jgi:hypothetical protein